MIERMCPEGVVYVRIDDACNILNGYAFQSKKYIDEGYRVIRISDVQSGYVSDIRSTRNSESSQTMTNYQRMH